MRTLVIGGVAAGTKAAAKLKREDRSAEVILITKLCNAGVCGGASGETCSCGGRRVYRP